MKSLKIAYLVNQYPRVSHTFVRREIAGLEAQGLSVARFAIRRCDETLIDEADQAERQQTRVILEAGPLGLFLALIGTLFHRPRSLFQAMAQALRLGRRSERGILVHLIYLAEACLLLRWLSEVDANHLHVHFGTNPATVALLCRSLGGPPYSFTVHGPEEYDAPRALSLGEKVHQSAFAVTVSHFGRSQLCRWSDHRDWSKIQLVRCGVEESFFDPSPEAFPEAPRLVCVGRLAEQKGQLLLVESAGRLRDQGFDFELTLVGDGPLRGDLEAIIEQLGLGEHVRLIGALDGDGVRREILASRAMVLPSFAEGLPVVLMEALALGRPVISTYVAGIPELVRPGANGWLVPAGSVEALVEAMAEVLTADVAELERMGQVGAAEVAERHDARIEADKLARLIVGDNQGVAGGQQASSATLADPVFHG